MATRNSIWTPQRTPKVGERVRLRGKKLIQRAGAKELVCVSTGSSAPKRTKRKR